MKKSTYFIIISCIFLSFLIIYYGARMIYFHNLSKQLQQVGEVTFGQIIRSKAYDSSIQMEEDNLYYKGNVLNNYVYYSNRYYRVLGIENGSILLVDDIGTILPFQEEFGSGDIYTWLNSTYVNSLSNYEEKLENSSVCSDRQCSTMVDSKVGLLTHQQYEKAERQGNYLNNKTYFWLSDGSYIDKMGNLCERDEGIYGVRAVLKLKQTVAYYGGTGTYYDPYFIDLDDALSFSETQRTSIKVGSYISYSDRIWRVVDTQDNIKVVLKDSIGKMAYASHQNRFNINDKTSIAYYLNHAFLEELDKNAMVEGTFHIGTFHTSYIDQQQEEIQSYVGLPEMGDLFINNYANAFLLTNTGAKNTVYKVIDGMLYADSYQNENEIHPVIYLNKNINIIEGYGTLESPFVVSEQ